MNDMVGDIVVRLPSAVRQQEVAGFHVGGVVESLSARLMCNLCLAM